MKAIQLSNKVTIIRHWFRWYRVQRGGYQWQRLTPYIHHKTNTISDPLDGLDDMTPEDAQAELERRASS